MYTPISSLVGCRDYLSDHGLPKKGAELVGTELRPFERVTKRLSAGKVVGVSRTSARSNNESGGSYAPLDYRAATLLNGTRLRAG